MSHIDHTEFGRLILQIERDLVAQARLRMLLGVADTTLASHKRDLRTETTRRQSATPGNGKRKMR